MAEPISNTVCAPEMRASNWKSLPTAGPTMGILRRKPSANHSCAVRCFSRGMTSVIGHTEWQPGKIDPKGPGISMDNFRKSIAARLSAPPSFTVREGDTLGWIAEAYGTSVDELRRLNPDIKENPAHEHSRHWPGQRVPATRVAYP